MGNLNDNIEQAISDFDDIEKAIEEQGINVPYDTDTSEYGNLIRSIPQRGTVTQIPLVFTSTIDMFADGGISVDSFEDYDNIAEAFNNGRIVVAQVTLADLDYEGNVVEERTASLICSGEKVNYVPSETETIPYVFQGVTTHNEIVTIECKKRMSTNGWNVRIQLIADAQDVDALETNINQSLQSCFKFIEGYEDKIDSYTGAMEGGTLYRINPPQDTTSLHWNSYYILAKMNEHGNLFQVKFFENANGIFFRTGTKTDSFSDPTWNEWVRTILSNEIDREPVENSLNLITSGGVHKALQNVDCADVRKSIALTQKQLEQLHYYGDKNIVPSYENLFTFTLNDEGTEYSIYSQWDESDDTIKDIVIPYEHNGIPVTAIGDFTFQDYHNIESVLIPNSVTSIGEEAFLFCYSLTSVNIPNSVTIIKQGAFDSCNELSIICSQGSTAEQYAKDNKVDIIYDKFYQTDDVPTENSTKLITSGGVYTAIGDVETSLENIIAKYGLGGEA